MILGLISFAITIFISLFVTPYIVNRIGSEAYGFVGLANNFVSYASLITVALNSMESRFVSVNLYANRIENANKYFTSVFFANCAIASILFPFIVIFVAFLDKFIQIPSHLVVDVKITFAIVLFQFLLSILLSRFEIALFVKNKLYLSSIFNVISAAIRLLCIVICFAVFGVKITYVVLGSLLGVIFTASRNIYYTKKLLPNMEIKKKYYEFKKIKEVISAGVWNLISKLSSILLDGLDLLIANIFIGPAQMGALAISKTVPAMFFSLRGTLSYPFDPTITKCYARGDIKETVKNVRLANKIENVFIIAPIAVFAIFGRDFFSLWVPNENSMLIQILSILSILSLIASSCINSVFSIFTVTAKVKIPSLIALLAGFLTTITVFIVVKNTNIGIYAIAGVSSCYTLLRNYIFTPLYGAHCLGIKKSTFYKEIVSGNICLLLNLAVGYPLKNFLPSNTWGMLIVSCLFVGIILLVLNILIVLRKNERKMLIKILKNKKSK